MNIFDFRYYQGEKTDRIVIFDILHHIYSKHIDLINIAKKIAQKIIVCELFAIKPQEITARDKFFKIMIFLGKYLPKPLLKIIDFLFLDNDGINAYQKRTQWNLDKKSLMEFYENMRFNGTYKILDEFIALWES